MSSVQHSQTVAHNLDIRPLAGRVGAEIGGVRLAGDLPEATIAAIEAALAKYKVTFFRDQGHLDDAGQERFAARLGELVAHPTNPAKAGSAALLEIDSARGRADRWHTDVTLADAYPKISVLRGVVIPPCGGDTMWANTVAAYDGLPVALKALAESLWAIHSNRYDYAAVRPESLSPCERNPVTVVRPRMTRSSQSEYVLLPAARASAMRRQRKSPMAISTATPLALPSIFTGCQSGHGVR